MYETDTERWISIEERVAKKNHGPCNQCKDDIEPGDTYARIAVLKKEEETVESVKFHTEKCSSIRRR
jgi:hypothetical protein